jgi:hypothetical protein
MPAFQRRFEASALGGWCSRNDGNAISALFDRWALPGEPSALGRNIRVGIRNGYLNLYVKGQSVAKITMGRDGPSLEVHRPYAANKPKPIARSGIEGAAAQKLERGHVRFNDIELADPFKAALVEGWIVTAETYASAEKRFVDDIVGANAGVIDLEMGLPAADESSGPDRVAPRMDLVVAQYEPEERISIAFWEAKCAINKELRAKGDHRPHVVTQLLKYEEWMGARIAQVQAAYQNSARSLLELHKLFRGKSNPPCVKVWQRLAAFEPIVISRPGILIGNYHPEGHDMMQPPHFEQCAASFLKNGHRDKLEKAGITVWEIGPNHQGAELPRLRD